MTAYLSPVFGAGAQLFNNQGIVLSGGKINTYQSGTTTPLATWTDSTQLVANANPIILDSAGRPANEIWLQESSTYKFILTDANNNTLGTWDNIAGLNDISTSVTVSEWQATNLTPTYISATSFSVPGNNTSVFPINRRVQIAVSAGTIYGYVVSSAFTSLTTVVIQPDSTSLDSGISSVNVGLLNSTNLSAPQQFLQMNAPITLASASSVAIGAALSANVTISGVVTITAFDNVIAGIIKFVKFTGILTLTHNGTSLILPDGINITTASGDQAVFRSLGSGNWECLNYQTALSTAYIPQNSQSAAYTTVLNDANKGILHPVADNNARTFTIDSNANVPYPVGTTLTFSNQINTLTIDITADTLTWVATNTSGSGTISANRIAVALKIATTTWLIYEYSSIGNATVSNASFVNAIAGSYCSHPIMRIYTATVGYPSKTHEVYISRSGTYRTYFYLTGQAGNNSYGRIFKNGVAHGTLHSFNATGTNFYTEDLAFAAGDLAQLYAGSDGGGFFTITDNLLILEGAPITPSSLYSYLTI